MHALVIYDSKFGNTELVANAIARAASSFGDVQVMNTAAAARTLEGNPAPPDLVFLGGPTQRRGPSPALRAFLDTLPDRFHGVPTAPFDTRYRGSTWIMGSAASEAAKVLRSGGGEVVTEPESFYIVRKGPMELQKLEPGEIARAEAWARGVASAAAQGLHATA
jgi:flavodoxin